MTTETTPIMPRGTEKSTGGKPVSGESQSPRPSLKTTPEQTLGEPKIDNSCRLEPLDTWQQCCTKIVDGMNALHDRMDDLEEKWSRRWEP